MTGLAMLAAIIIMSICVLLSIPLNYRLVFATKDPMTFSFQADWLGKAFLYCFSIQSGKEAEERLFLKWRDYNRDKNYEEWLSREVSAEVDLMEDDLGEDDWLTYDQLAGEQGELSGWRGQLASRLEWLSLLRNWDFLRALFSFVGALLYHSRVRYSMLQGVVGLSAPHKTGILAGILYSTIPLYIYNISFDYLTERLDLQCRLGGRILPLTVIECVVVLLWSPPVRKLIKAEITNKGGAESG